MNTRGCDKIMIIRALMFMKSHISSILLMFNADLDSHLIRALLNQILQFYFVYFMI
jgi:hypothetical protein